MQQGRAKNVKELVQKALDDGLAAGQILDEGLLSGMSIIGENRITSYNVCYTKLLRNHHQVLSVQALLHFLLCLAAGNC